MLQQESGAPLDLRERAIELAGAVLDASGNAPTGGGVALARRTLESGQAWRKFQAICEAQGGMREPPEARLRREIRASAGGTVSTIDNRRLARVAKLAGAPRDPAAGLRLHARLGDRIDAGQPLFTIHAEAPGQLRYATDYVTRTPPILRIDEAARP